MTVRGRGLSLAAVPDSPVSSDELASLRRYRDRVFARVTWWENHRTEALLPVAMGAFALGFGVGYALHKLVSVPYPVAYFLGIATLLVSGKVVDRRFSVHRIDAIDARIARMQRTQGRSPPR